MPMALLAENIRYLVVHCADTPDDEALDARAIHDMHLGFGWHGIGYHWVICRDGILQSGRPEYWVGAHVKGHNEISLGVCLIGRQNFTEAQMHEFHDKLLQETRRLGAEIKDIAFCPHHPLAVSEKLRTPCSCRKPKPGMIFGLAEKWQIDLRQSLVIGDKPSDIEAGQAAGCSSFLVGPDQSLLDVAKTALAETNMLDEL